MSYIYNGQQIRILHPVHSISVNNKRVVFADKCGQKNTKFDNAVDAKLFVNWLLSA
jgi:hypothetical protein